MEVAEVVQGDVMFHNLFASRLPDSEASCENPSLVPYWYGQPVGLDRVVNAGYQLHKQLRGSQSRLIFSYTTDWPKGSWPLQWRISKVKF